jgi:hypothetical protein
MDTQISPQIITAVVGFLGSCIGAVSGLVGSLIIAVLSAKYNKRTLEHLQHEEERKDILRKLNEFYGPYQQRLETSRQLYEKFRSGKPEKFRTLIALLEGQKFSENDEHIYQEILKITNELEELRIGKSGLVDDPELQFLLAKAGAHFRLIAMAFEGKLSGEVERFKDYVYPRELNGKINERIKKLQDRLYELNRI